MSSTANSHKLNGNLIPLSSSGKSQLQPQQPKQQQKNSQHQQQHTSQQYSQLSHHLHNQQHHHHYQQQQQHLHPTSSIVSSSSSSSAATSTSHSQLLQHQTQTVATVHQQMSGGHHHNHHNNNHNQPTNNINCNIPIAQHTIPPRYQPPPQPPGEILKHIPLSSTKTSATTSYFSGPPEISAPHLNIRYPPEIPKLSSIYIPENVKNSSNSTRFTQRPPPHRLSGGHIPVLVQNSSSHSQNSEDQISSRQQHNHHNQQQQQPQNPEMLKFVRKTDTVDSPGASNGSVSQQGAIGLSGQQQTPLTSMGSGRLTTEQNRHLQSLLTELRSLKEANQRLSEDNQELRDLCCFLDDDRQKGRKLAREWQRFGRYTASVMRQEVSAYQNKLRQLDDKQQELIRDNLELKELCLYLDEERAHVAANTLCANCGAPTRPTLRDDGDGSSSSTNADETISAAIRQYERRMPTIEANYRSTLSDQTLQYVRSLEKRIQQLEEERSAAGIDTTNTTTISATNGITNGGVIQNSTQQISDPISGRPEAVVRALQVLEVREQLERDLNNLGKSHQNDESTTPTEQMDDGEKALVREMCNLVWRKLEEGPSSSNVDPV